MVRRKQFTETPIHLCGKELYFKRCPAKTIRIYDEAIRDKAKSVEGVQKEREELEEKVENAEKMVKNIQKKIDLIDRKEDPTDEELDASIKLLDKQETYFNELKKVREELTQWDNEHENSFEKIGNEMNELLAEKVEAMLDGITKQEFLEEYDPVDIRIATNLSKYYELCIIGEKESVIQKHIQRDSRASREALDEFRR